MEPLFRSVVVGLVPQPRQFPPAPFEREELQRAFFDVNRVKNYDQFAFLPGDSGAQFTNSQQDRVVLTPQLIQFFTPIETTVGKAREDCLEVLSRVAERLKLDQYVQSAIDLTAHVPAPGERPDARLFVRDQLLREADHVAELGADFFAGGVKFRRSLGEPVTRDEILSIEPLLADNTFLWVTYTVQNFAPNSGLEPVAEWINDAAEFIAGPAMAILEA